MERKIEIIINPGKRLPYEVSVNGERIDNLRSFEIKVSNEPHEGQQEGPYYRAEQYWPIMEGREVENQ